MNVFEQGYLAVRQLDGERYLILQPLTYGRLRLAVATEDCVGEHW